MSNPQKKIRRRYISSDAQLALERLVVGRECNSFDTFNTERKVAAYMTLVTLGLVNATITENPGKSHPNITVQSVTTLGKKTYENQTNFDKSNSGLVPKILIIVLTIAILTVILLKSLNKI